jgi:hypothetical protein
MYKQILYWPIYSIMEQVRGSVTRGVLESDPIVDQSHLADIMGYNWIYKVR